MRKIVLMIAFGAIVYGANAQVKVLNNGNVGIGTNSPARKLDIKGELYIESNEISWGRAVWTKVHNKSTCAYNLYNSYYGQDVFYVCGEGYIWSKTGAYYGSDIALKKNITPIGGALDLVKKMNGVKYQYKDVANSSKSDSLYEKSLTENYRLGLIAQDVELILPEVVKTMQDSTKAISYTDLTALLIEAIKEQQNIIEDLQQEVETLRNALVSCCSNKTQKSMQEFDLGEVINDNIEELKVFQNAPNPFTETTIISCYIPETIKKAELCIYDMSGSRLKCLTVTDRGTTTIQIQAGQLAAGVYTYLLIGDGKNSDAKQMILTR